MNRLWVLFVALLCAGAVQAGTPGITGLYAGTHALTVWNDATAVVLGTSTTNPNNAWSWDFNNGSASFDGGMLSLGFPYSTGPITLVDNGDGTYTGTYDLAIGAYSGTGTTTWDITNDGLGNLAITTVDTDANGVPGTALLGVMPLPLSLQWDGSANQEQDIALDPAELDFGLVATGTTADAVLVVGNAGAIDLRVDAIASADLLAAPFSILDASGCIGDIPPGGSCNIRVRFAPTVEGPFTDSFDILSNDPDEPSVTVTVRGRGAPPEPVIVLDAAALSFGEVVVGTQARQAITVSNQGGGPLQITAITLEGADWRDFDYDRSADCITTPLASDALCTISVSFYPVTTASAAATLIIESNADNRPRAEVALAGTGTRPVASFTGRYAGTYSMVLWNATSNSVLGNSVPAGQNIAWVFDFDAGTVEITNAGLSTGVDYLISPVPTPLVRNADGTYTASYSILIGDKGPGDTTTTWRITENDDVLTITTLNADGDAVPGTTLPGVLPLPVGIVMDGTAITADADCNGDGLLDVDALTLGLDPCALNGDTDGDGIPDLAEIGGDIANPLDSDGDGVIDALEPGDTAFDARIAAGLRVPAVGGTAAVITEPGQRLFGVGVAAPMGGPPDVVFAHGAIQYTTTAPPGGTVRMRLQFSLAFPDNLVVYKIDGNGAYSVLPQALWTRIDDHTLELAVTDGDPLTDADGLVNGLIVDRVALGNDVRAGFDFTGGGGGCSLGADGGHGRAGEWLLVLLFLAWLGAGRLQGRLRRGRCGG